MVVLVIHIDRIFSLERERNAPIFINPDSPMTFERALERVKPPTRRVHVRGIRRIIESRQHQSQPALVARMNSGTRAFLEVSLQPLVAEALDHDHTVTCNATLYKYSAMRNRTGASLEEIEASGSPRCAEDANRGIKRFVLFISPTTARPLRVKPPQSILLRAERVIGAID